MKDKLYKRQKFYSGFTIIELSIVIVIIGLIVAGVLGGRGLVQQSTIKAAITQSDAIKVAYNTFLLEYNTPPGDLGNASSYWGAGVRNGNGNGILDGTYTETLLAWNHLNLAGLTHYSLQPYPISGNVYAGRVGKWAPVSPFGNNAYGRPTGFQFNGGSLYLVSGQSLWLSVENPDSNVENVGAAISPVEADAIDSKIDDGFPLTGKVWSADSAGGGGDGVDHWGKCSGVRWYYANPKTNQPYQVQFDDGDHCTLVFWW